MKRVRIRKSQGWMDSDYICLSVSCGKKYHDEDNFAAALDLVQKSGKPILIDLSDTLQRYNFMACDIHRDLAYTLANRQGLAWMNRHADLLKRTTVLRWSHWLNHKDFCSVYGELRKAIRRSTILSLALDEDVRCFVARQDRHSTELEKHSRQFILEEAVGEILLGRTYQCSRLYPGKELRTLQLLRQKEIDGVPAGLENTKYYRFTIETDKSTYNSIKCMESAGLNLAAALDAGFAKVEINGLTDSPMKMAILSK